MNYHYEVGYTSPEDSGFIMLSHDEYYDEAMFRNLCLSVAPEAAKKYKEREKSDDIRFESFYADLADALVERYGFERVKPVSSMIMFGWCDIMDQTAWEGYRCEDMEFMRKVISGEILASPSGLVKAED